MKFSLHKTTFIIIIALVVNACSDKKKIDNYINQIPILPAIKDEINFDHTASITDTLINGISYTCVTKTGEETKNMDEFITFNPNSGVLYPGSLIHGLTLKDGSLTPIKAERNGGILTLEGQIFKGYVDVDLSNDSLLNGFLNKTSFVNESFDFLKTIRKPKYDTLKYSVNLEQITPSNVTNAVIKLINNIPDGKQVSRTFYEQQEFHDAETDLLRLGVSAKWGTSKVSAALSTLKKENSSKYIIKVTQPYFDISFEQPIHGVSRPSDFFKNVKYDEFKKNMDLYMKTANDTIDPPSYIKSVTYGRTIFIIASSSESQDSLNATMNAVYNGAVSSASLDLSASRNHVLQNSSLTVFALGGAAEATVSVITGGTTNLIDSLKKYLFDGANYSKESPAYPISFVARYLKTDDVAKLGLSYKYNIPSCIQNPKKIKAIKMSFFVTDDDKDKEDIVYAYLTKGNTKIAEAGPWGVWRAWPKNTGPYPYTFSVEGAGINEVNLNDVKLWVTKYSGCGGGQNWGCGWHFILNLSAINEDGSEQIFNSYPNCMLGNGSSGIQVFPIIH
ncbi:MAG: thiol-activated cytolysin family protein [Ginsengibacter sp.]